MITEKCIICGKEAEVWTGHVLRGARKEMITAGWCKQHLNKSEDITLMQGAACFGQWKTEHGVRPQLEPIG